MYIYLISLVEDSRDSWASLARHFPSPKHTIVSQRIALVVSDELNTSEVVDKAGLNTEILGIVARIDPISTNGWLPVSVWEWIKARNVRT